MNKGILFVTGLVLSVLVMSGFVFAYAGSSGGSETATATVTVPGWITATISNPPNFGTLSPGGPLTTATEPQFTVLIGGETNVITDIGISGTNFANGVFPVSRMKFNGKLNEGSYGNDEDYDTSLKPVTRCQDIPVSSSGNTCMIGHKISVPLAMPAGVYTSTVTVMVTPSA